MNGARNNRCDHPGCLSRTTETYLVGLGGMPAFYCSDHAPGCTCPVGSYDRGNTVHEPYCASRQKAEGRE